MRIIHIVGRSKNGKTTLMVELVREMTRRGMIVGTLKHSGHDHELDRPGKDSFRHREAGAIPAAISTPSQLAVFLPATLGENPFDRLAPLFGDCDIILVEGYVTGPGKKVEIWRAATGKEPFFLERPEIQAVITDDPVETALPVLPLSNVPAVADFLLNLEK
jgi:molybdopterin-guanine dinucleotide biosynthesis protein B